MNGIFDTYSRILLNFKCQNYDVGGKRGCCTKCICTLFKILFSRFDKMVIVSIVSEQASYVIFDVKKERPPFFWFTFLWLRGAFAPRPPC